MNKNSDSKKEARKDKEPFFEKLDESLQHVVIPDLSEYEFPSDYEAFEDENLNMLP